MIEDGRSPSHRKKAELRQRLWDYLAGEGLSNQPHGRIPPFEGQNRAAERLRRWPRYQRARCIMVPPDDALYQVRLNALRDGKRLLIASPGLREGFYELAAGDVAPSRWGQAVRTTGVLRHGRRLPTRPEALGRIDLLVTGAVAVDTRGGRIGKGHGYFDLEYGIFRQLGCIGEETPVVGLVHDCQIVCGIPLDEGDVPVDWILTPEQILSCTERPPKPQGIPWERLSHREIRRIKPLWEIRKTMEGTGPDSVEVDFGEK